MLESILIGVSLAMDAFAICICQGLRLKENKFFMGIKLGVVFGLFQTLMPILGFYLGNIFSNKISTYGNIISFIILVAIGINMLKENGDENCEVIVSFKELFILGVATSIDAFAVGLSFAIKGENNILITTVIIGVVTFIISFLGTTLGNKVGNLLENKAHYLGGSILILLGIKTLISNFI